MEGRFVDLEIRYTHLERQYAELSQIVFDQQKQIEALVAYLHAPGASPAVCDLRASGPHLTHFDAGVEVSQVRSRGPQIADGRAGPGRVQVRHQRLDLLLLIEDDLGELGVLALEMGVADLEID